MYPLGCNSATAVSGAGKPTRTDHRGTELVNFKLGRSQHRSPAHLLTEHFGLSLFYGDVMLIRDGQETVLR